MEGAETAKVVYRFNKTRLTCDAILRSKGQVKVKVTKPHSAQAMHSNYSRLSHIASYDSSFVSPLYAYCGGIFDAFVVKQSHREKRGHTWTNRNVDTASREMAARRRRERTARNTRCISTTCTAMSDCSIARTRVG